jgi:hypothetical protein
MDQNQRFRQMLEFNQAAFNNALLGITLVQEHAELVARELSKASWLTEEGRAAIDEWVQTYRQGCVDFKKLMNGKFCKVESFFESTLEN